MLRLKTTFSALLAGLLVSSIAHAEPPTKGTPCERQGAIYKVGGGPGAEVFNCLDGRWERTSVVGDKQYRITATFKNGEEYRVVTLSGEPTTFWVGSKTIEGHAKRQKGFKQFQFTATASDGDRVTLVMNVSVSEMEAVGAHLTQWRTTNHTGIIRTLVLHDGEKKEVLAGELDMTIEVAEIS